MDEFELRKFFSRVKSGDLSIDEFVSMFKGLPYDDLGYAKVDHHRVFRQGLPEVLYCAGKTRDQIIGIVKSFLSRASSPILATRISEGDANALIELDSGFEYNTLAGLAFYLGKDFSHRKKQGNILLISAGTSDLPVLEEAYLSAYAFGNNVEKLVDVGVAGIHRLLSYRELLSKARVIIVVAGMDGALASVVGGLVNKPVIAVPTSVGYGANFGGLAALLSMLNSCSPSVVTVNIDNGFGAAYAASLMNAL